MVRPTILADENLHSAIIRALKVGGFEVFSVMESMPGASDRDVLEKARALSAILMTEDSDFGELVFSYGLQAIGIVYLRYEWNEVEEITKAILELIVKRPLAGSFYTLTPKKIRERRLP